MAAQEEPAKALKVYQSFFDGLTSSQSLPAAIILLNDRNKLLPTPSGNVQQEPLPKDLRIVVSNLHPDPSFALSVTDPFGVTSYKGETSPTGVTITSTIGLSEVVDREASKGTYKLAARCNRDQLLELTIYRNFAKPDEEITRRTLKLPASKRDELILLESIEFK